MLNNVLKRIYFKIHISRYFSSLQSLNELYTTGNKDEYLRKMEDFYSDLLRFPQAYYKNAQGIQSNDELVRSFSITHDSPVNSLYSGHIKLFLKIEQSLKHRSANELNSLLEDIATFLEKLYISLFPKNSTSKRNRYLIPGTIVISSFILLVVLYSPLKKKYFREKEQYNLLANEETYRLKTIKDILTLKEVLTKYYNDTKSYPKSSGGWDAIIAAFGESKKAWIPGLVPAYINELPVDPRNSKDSHKQYMYKSDGIDFKLIAHNPIAFSEIVNDHPEFTDPVRPTWALGAWSDGAKNW